MDNNKELNSIEYEGITKEHFFPISYFHETSVSNKFSVGYGEDFTIDKVIFSLILLQRERSFHTEGSTKYSYIFKLKINLEYYYEKEKLLIYEEEEIINTAMVVNKCEEVLQNTREDYLITSGKVVRREKNEVIYGVNILVALGDIDDN